ncbi:histidine kinase [Chryseobacterium fluminis]|uniref:sensor histidine kinase n=1 Tax=Chryseobacterium fluminis TaxID=2983606 RepID=UPI002251C767|nr:histidine kinase [Chryseobacterium sp. MMS21-Ot14]UZU00089.1 histidine kinase [Chryseobacterium sp. MMS21-Ot14]
MFLLLNIVVILMIFRGLFSSEILKKLMSYRWKFLLGFQHAFFFLVLVLIIYFTENSYLNPPDLIWSIIFNMMYSLGIYYWVYQYLVPKFYLSNKYPEFILYALMCFLTSSLFRILSEPAIFGIPFMRGESNITFLYNVYLTQAIVILVASFLGITKDKFLIEQDVADLGEQKEQLYIDLLKSKLSPHFLLNTLNNIYVSSFVPTEKTSHSILELSKLLQYIIYDSGKEKISIGQEFSSLKSLAELYQLKFNNQLDILFELQHEEVWDVIEIPPSVFLTLFENSLKHSAIGMEPSSFVKVGCTIENREIIFRVENSIAENKCYSPDIGYQGLGNKAIAGILEKYYPGQYHFSSQALSSKNYESVLKINYNA